MLADLAMMNEELPWFFPAFFFVTGACVGSFLNVCIYRIPAKLSVVYPGSRCGACGAAIAWYDNIPILSWIILRGRARCCGAPFSVRYALIEALTGGLFLGLWLTQPPVLAIVYMVFVSMLIAAAFIDLDTMELPERFATGGFALALVIALFVPALHGHTDVPHASGSLLSFFEAIQGGFIASALIVWIAITFELLLRKEVMGFGDVKLMGFIGAMLGWEGGVFALFGGSVIGTVLLIFFLLGQKLFGKSQPTEETDATAGEEPRLAVVEPCGDGSAVATGVLPTQPTAPEEASSEADQTDENSLGVGAMIPFGPMLALGAVAYLFGGDVYFETQIVAVVRELLFLGS